jgi:hypothetical protein
MTGSLLFVFKIVITYYELGITVILCMCVVLGFEFMGLALARQALYYLSHAPTPQ